MTQSTEISRSARRFAVIQHGDMAEARRLIGSGQPETYYGMAYTLGVLDELFGESDRFIISLNAPQYDVRKGPERLCSIPQPSLPRGVPRRWAEAWRSRAIVSRVRAFEPTHLLLRTAGSLAWRLLHRLRPLRLNTLVVCASHFPSCDGRPRVLQNKLIDELNQPHVFRVGNHRWPATQSMIDAGLEEQKAFAWDWPKTQLPETPPRRRRSDAEAELLYVGTVSQAKGVGDLVAAMPLLLRNGRRVRLTVVGEGPDLQALRAQTNDDPSISFVGRRSNEEVRRRMSEADVVVVPSRPCFAEGFPLTLTEALAVRTPVVVSDHPVMARALVDGEGVRFFAAGNPEALATTVTQVLEDSSLYARLSDSTMAAMERVACEATFGDLIRLWRDSFE